MYHRRTDSGVVEAENIRSERMLVRTDSGKIRLMNVIGVVDTKTDSGSIEAENIMSDNITAKTYSGKIHLLKIRGEATAETDNGNIFISTKEIAHLIYAKSESGKIEIETEQEPIDLQFDVKTNSGEVNLFNKYTKEASIGKGSIIMKLKTDSGNISVVTK